MAGSPDSRKKVAHPRRRFRRDRRGAQARRTPTSTSSSSTSTTTTPSSRCSTRSRPTCSSRRRSGIRCATSSTTSRTSPSTGRARPAIDLAARTVAVRGDGADAAYDYLVLGLGAGVNFFGTEGAAEHAFPMYTLADALRLRKHVLEKWEAADKDPGADRRRRAQRGRRRRRRRPASRASAPWPSSTATSSRRTTRSIPQEQARLILVEAGPELFTMFKTDIRKYTKQDAREARRRGDARRARLGDRADAREAQVGHGAEGAHARVGRRPAGEPDRAVARHRARARQPHPRRAGPQHRGPPRGVRDGRHRVDQRQEHERDPSPARLASRSSRASARARTSRGSSRARRPSRSTTPTRGRWRRSAAARPSCSSRAAGR